MIDLIEADSIPNTPIIMQNEHFSLLEDFLIGSGPMNPVHTEFRKASQLQSLDLKIQAR